MSVHLLTLTTIYYALFGATKDSSTVVHFLQLIRRALGRADLELSRGVRDATFDFVDQFFICFF